MADTLKWVIAILVLLAILAAVGLSLERADRRKLLAFAREHGGTFDPGSSMEGAPVPEAAPFDAPLVVSSTDDDDGDPPSSSTEITYRRVVRITGDEASYAVALRQERSSNTRGEWETTSYLVCFVTLARADLPPLEVFAAAPGGSDWALEAMGTARPVKLELSRPAPGFADAFELHIPAGAAEPTPEALDRVIDRTVQAELVAQRKLIAGLRVHGNVVRLQAVGSPVREQHRGMYEVARKLAIVWAGRSRP